MFQYSGTVARWIDGDTVELLVDLGFKITVRETFRLRGVDTPERAAGAAAKARCEQLAPIGTQVSIKSNKPRPDDKYGRWLVDVVGAGGDVATHLLQEGLAVPYYGGKKNGVP